MTDPINEEIHKYRAEHARKFNFDLAAICKDLKRRSSKLKTVRLPAKRISQEKKNSVRPC
jgi:ParB-like chromosome segregation protein Spo0J